MRALALIFLTAAVLLMTTATRGPEDAPYVRHYQARMQELVTAEEDLLRTIKESDVTDPVQRNRVVEAIGRARHAMKATDLWLRYLEPNAHKLINGPLPVEWETEVFEKFETPYKRIGMGLTLAELHLDEDPMDKDGLVKLIGGALDATKACMEDSTVQKLRTPDHFLYCDRLFLLNMAAIYTTGFECPDTARVIPELLGMMQAADATYDAFAAEHPDAAMPPAYRDRFREAIAFVAAQPTAYSAFDHFTFIRDHVDPLFGMMQELIRVRRPVSRSYMDFSLRKDARSIFDKGLYTGQVTKGVFRRVEDEAALARLDALGGLLFFDPLLSGNDQRSCASCHRPDHFFTDTTMATPLRFDHQGKLDRNTPTLVNAALNHLLMVDGQHIDPQAQARGVITSPDEMACAESEALRKVLSCATYRTGFEDLLTYTPQYRAVTMDHVASAITWHYGNSGSGYSGFDRAMRAQGPVDEATKRGFNLFMSKAQCATCHFVPHFNGVKPPYIGSEFEVLGTPADPAFAALSDDLGRYDMNPAEETHRAFRTGTLRNIARTPPYMHNGVFRTLTEVIDFYDGGGGAGRGLDVPNQTLSSDSLRLTAGEKAALEVFMRSLNEDITVERPPARLPASRIKALNSRTIGGTY